MSSYHRPVPVRKPERVRLQAGAEPAAAQAGEYATESADEPAAAPAHPVWLSVDDDLRRSRLLVFFRLPILIPHLVWLSSGGWSRS